MTLTCSKCLGSGWQDATLQGLTGVRVVDKDGSFVQLPCDHCNATGQIEMIEPPKGQ